MAPPDENAALVEMDWRGLGCKATRRVGGMGRVKGGRAAWRLRAPRRSREDWAIEAGHCPYLGVRPYEYGDDAWRISIQVPDPMRDEGMLEVAHIIATSEADAFASVAWLDAVATPSGSKGAVE